MFEVIKAIIFGIVEGITEWLPISSTGHMILLNEFLTLDVSKEFWSMFLVVIQLGAILAVVVLFWKMIWPFALTGNLSKISGDGNRKLQRTGGKNANTAEVGRENRKSRGSNRKKKGFWQQEYWVIGPVAVRMEIITNWLKIVLACLPAILFVLLDLDDYCDRLFYNPVCVSIALIVFGIAFILVENRNKGKKAAVENMQDITWKMAFLIGLFQLLAAAFPGTSRSGATIVGALLIGISRKAASEFTFILAIPVMLGASLLEILDFGFVLTGEEWAILLAGLVSAFVVSIVVIKFLLGYIRKHDFKAFGWYRIVLGVIVLAYFGIAG